jgi:hypothetical protein
VVLTLLGNYYRAACSFELRSPGLDTRRLGASSQGFSSVRSLLCHPVLATTNIYLYYLDTYCDDNVQATTPVPAVTCRFAQTTMTPPGSLARALAQR